MGLAEDHEQLLPLIVPLITQRIAVNLQITVVEQADVLCPNIAFVNFAYVNRVRCSFRKLPVRNGGWYVVKQAVTERDQVRLVYANNVVIQRYAILLNPFFQRAGNVLQCLQALLKDVNVISFRQQGLRGGFVMIGAVNPLVF